MHEVAHSLEAAHMGTEPAGIMCTRNTCNILTELSLACRICDKTVEADPTKIQRVLRNKQQLTVCHFNQLTLPMGHSE